MAFWTRLGDTDDTRLDADMAGTQLTDETTTFFNWIDLLFDFNILSDGTLMKPVQHSIHLLSDMVTAYAKKLV
jgi:hypothetical protein